MKQLENKLKELQMQGYENIGIGQVLQWMAEIKRENRLKRARSNDRQLVYTCNCAPDLCANPAVSGRINPSTQKSLTKRHKPWPYQTSTTT